MTEIRKRASEGLKTGDTFSVTRTFSKQDVHLFAEISRDYNPVHFDARFARVKEFDGCICHGLLVASLLTEIGGQIGWLASGMDMDFIKPVYFGETIKCVFTITEIDEGGRAKAESVFTNEKGIVVLKAVLTGIIPGDGEKQVLKDILAEKETTCRKAG